MLAILSPTLVGIFFRYFGEDSMSGARAVCSFLNNAGGAWDNAKKLVETGYGGGKGSSTHAASVTGDTIGDPFKDAAGPSLHVFIKLIATVTLVLAPLFVGTESNGSFNSAPLPRL
jgi:Na+/H+-translocating membrane pyrophosphatase